MTPSEADCNKSLLSVYVLRASVAESWAGRVTMALLRLPLESRDPSREQAVLVDTAAPNLTRAVSRHISAQDEELLCFKHLKDTESRDSQTVRTSHIMDGWKTTGKTSMPQLVVKIVGGKQIKYFTEGTKSPTDDLEVTNSSEDRNSPPNRVTDGDLGRKSSFHDREPVGAVEHRESLLDALRQVPDRRCVTAPCGDRSRSYIHLKSTNNLFLRLQMPLKLSTLACVFRSFSDTRDPEQVHYKELLQFIQRAVQDEKQQSVEAEIWDASVASTDLESVISVTEDQRETWLQRFQKMEMALQMCDTKNTGYVDRDQAKRLILNYSLIFDLNLSPLKVNEVTRNTQREGKVHLASALRQLKEL